MSVIVCSLCFNLFSECQKATERLYRQNEGTPFKHLLVDLSFPLIDGNTIPENIEEAKEQNSESLKSLAHQFGSEYVKIKNIGCSQNWNEAIKYVNPNPDDIFVSCEPDEVQNENGWVQAQTDVIRGGLAYCAPRLTEHKILLEKTPHATLENINGHEVYVMNASLNYGNFSFAASFIKKIGGFSFPSTMTIYGGLEDSLRTSAHRHNERWGLLRNITTTHTDFERQNPNTSSLLRYWKNFIVLTKRPDAPQISFDDWLIVRKQNPHYPVLA